MDESRSVSANDARFARWVFRLAGVYGVLALAPMFFLENRIGSEQPPAITHPEFFYGFVGVGLAWQFAFLVIGTDPIRYRALMLPSFLEKASFFAAAVGLFAYGRIPQSVLAMAVIDITLGVLFLWAYFRTRGRCRQIP